jgi:hypothetical protein
MSIPKKVNEREAYALSRLRDSPLKVNATSKSEPNSRSSEGTQTDRERQHESGNSSEKG